MLGESGEDAGPKSVSEITESALKHTENSEPLPLLAKRKLRQVVENDGFIKEWQEGQRYGLSIRKPLYEEDEQENREKIDKAIEESNDKMRSREIREDVNNKLEENG